jgi:purine-binding chemotaxis protein CheW
MNTLESLVEISTQYLFFALGEEKYAVKSNLVQEIVEFRDIRKVPKSNLAIKGVSNVRGDLIPVVDLKVRLGIGETEVSKKTSFIIFMILNKVKQKNMPIALMVDLVDEVDDILENNVLETPDFGTKINQKYIENVIKYNDDYISILDINFVLDINELSQVE